MRSPKFVVCNVVHLHKPLALISKGVPPLLIFKLFLPDPAELKGLLKRKIRVVLESLPENLAFVYLPSSQEISLKRRPLPPTLAKVVSPSVCPESAG